jgi:hypothetical protein
LYGFRRLTVGPDAGAYYHELFLRGRPSLSQRMVRQKIKGTFRKQPADASSEPNFYTMSVVQPEHYVPVPQEGRVEEAAASSSPDTYAGGARYNAAILSPTVTLGETAAPQPLYNQQLIQQQQQQQQQPYGPGTPSAQQASATSVAAHRRPPSLPLSPGLASVHGAAHLLHGIASGFKSSSSDAAFLGPAAASTTPSTFLIGPPHQQRQQQQEPKIGDQNKQPKQPQRSASRTARASFLQPDKLDTDNKNGG